MKKSDKSPIYLCLDPQAMKLLDRSPQDLMYYWNEEDGREHVLLTAPVIDGHVDIYQTRAIGPEKLTKLLELKKDNK